MKTCSYSFQMPSLFFFCFDRFARFLHIITTPSCLSSATKSAILFGLQKKPCQIMLRIALLLNLFFQFIQGFDSALDLTLYYI